MPADYPSYLASRYGLGSARVPDRIGGGFGLGIGVRGYCVVLCILKNQVEHSNYCNNNLLRTYCFVVF